MKRCIHTLTAIAIAAGSVVTFAATPASAAPVSTAVYDSIGAVTPTAVASVGFEATSSREFGDLVQLAPGARRLDTVTVLLSSWGCENGSWNLSNCITTPGATFDHPITLNLYNSTPGVGTGVGSLVATKTQTFSIPYRPSENDFFCTLANDGKWWDGTACRNGLATPVTFTFPALPAVPTNLIWTVAYDTTHHGYAPIGELAPCYTEPGGCGYDALNVGADSTAASLIAGVDVDADSLVWNTTFAPNYTDGGVGGVGVNRFDTNWTGYRPTARINTIATTETETTQVVKVTDSTWGFLAEGTPGSTGAYVAGPATPPLGNGSAEFTVSAATQSHLLGKAMLAGTKLVNLTEFAYSSNQPAGSVAVALQFNISYSGGAGYQGRLVYEPTYTVGTVPAGWQRWDTLGGKWWASNTSPAGSNGLCGQASPCTWSQVLTNWPNAQINPNPSFGAVLFKLGAGPASFTGNVDHLTIGVDDGSGNITVTNYDFENTPQCTTTCYVDTAIGNDLNGGTSPADAKKTVQAGANQVSPTGTVVVAAGTYNEDVSITKALTLQGAGIDQAYLVGPAGGSGATVTVAAPNVVIEGFTITRAGNALATWVDPTLNSAGIAVQSQGNFAEIRNNKLTGNRTGIDINNSNGNVVVDNVIDYNRSGMLFRNQTDNTVVTGNFITNNWTVGMLFLDGSGGTNVPVQSAANSDFGGNAISGNWYGGVVDRQSGGSLPAPGTNVKDFSGNWWGTNSPVVTTANSAEQGYATSPIPLGYPGGSAINPGGAPDIAGPASANIDYTPRLEVGTDTLAAVGYQGSTVALTVTDKGAQSGAASRIQEGIDDVLAAGTVHVTDGAYTEAAPVLITKAVSLLGPNTGISPNDATTPLTANPARVAEATLAPVAGGELIRVGADDVTIDGFRFTDPGTTGASNVALIGAGGNFGGQADDLTITNNLFDGITRIAVYLNGPGVSDNAVIDDNRVANPTRASGCGATPVASGVCGHQLFNLWQTDHVSFQRNVVFAPAANGDRVRVLQVSFPNSASGQTDSPAANATIADNTIRNSCVYTCFSLAFKADNVEITGNDVQIDTGNIVQFRQEWTGGRVLIDHNTFVASAGAAVILDTTVPLVASDLSNVTISRNAITAGGVANLRTETVSAVCNWWGQAAGPLGAQNTGPVDLSNPLITSNLDGPCNAPLTVTGVAGNAEVAVSWAAPVPDGSTITGYVVTAAPGGATCTTTGATTCTITNLVNGTAYTFTVIATTASEGNSPPSAPSAPVTPVGPPPTSVAGVAGNTQVTVSWVAPAPAGPTITGYTVTAAPGGATCTTTGATTCTVTGLTNGTPYTFTVVATTAANGNSQTSAPSAPVTPVVPPPTSVVGAPGNAQVAVSWTASPVGGPAITGYTVTAAPGGATCTTTGATTCTVTNLVNGTAYTFTVVATTASSGSSVASAASAPVTPVGPPPTSVAGVAGNTQVTVSWVAPAPAGPTITGYTVTAAPGGATCTTTGATTCTVTGLTNGTPYTFTVVATTAANGNSQTSAPSAPVTPVVPISPVVGVPDFNPVNPQRVADTRAGAANGLRVVTKTAVSPTNVLEVKVADLPGGLTPATGIGAVSLNVTAANPGEAGFLTVYPCAVRNTVSNLNFGKGADTANAVITPISATGTVCVYASTPTDVIVDINGWLASPSGLTAVNPQRVADTRSGAANGLRVVTKTAVSPTNVLEVKVADLPGGLTPATGIGAVSLNVTAANPGEAGFLTVYPCAVRNTVSNLNFGKGADTANAVITPISATGTVCVYASTPTDVIIDINGWFSNAPTSV